MLVDQPEVECSRHELQGVGPAPTGAAVTGEPHERLTGDVGLTLVRGGDEHALRGELIAVEPRQLAEDEVAQRARATRIELAAEGAHDRRLVAP